MRYTGVNTLPGVEAGTFVTRDRSDRSVGSDRSVVALPPHVSFKTSFRASSFRASSFRTSSFRASSFRTCFTTGDGGRCGRGGAFSSYAGGVLVSFPGWAPSRAASISTPSSRNSRNQHKAEGGRQKAEGRRQKAERFKRNFSVSYGELRCQVLW